MGLQTSFQIVHGSSVNGSVLIDVAIFDSQRAFDEFGRHTDQSAHDHPKGGTGAAQVDGDADACNGWPSTRRSNF